MNIKPISSFEEYKQVYQASVDDPEGFWSEIAEKFTWNKKWDKVLEWNFDEPKIEWFKGGKLNITENALDRHLEERGDKVALLWEPNNPEDEVITYTYKQLHSAVCRFANVLKNNGIQKGDVVCIYMPMIPQLTIAVLACARIGAIHSVVFAGFSANSLADRINDASCKMVLTTDGLLRGAKKLNLKSIVDTALESCQSVNTVLVFPHTGDDVNMVEGRDKNWKNELNEVDDNCPVEYMDAEDILFVLYTSGSTGKPKGVVHTIGGYMVYTAYSFVNVFQYQENDIYWCTADVGWITGHSYIIYGPLVAGATTMMFEGVPTWPNPDRFWQIVEKHQVNQFYTAPTAIRALMAKGNEWVENYEMNSLKVLGTVGEPINKEAWDWYNVKVGKKRCPIVDTWWQTETGGILISPIPNVTELIPTYATYPLPGVQPILVDKDGNELTDNDVEGLLCIKFPWPAIIRTTYGDHERCKQTYFSTFKGLYFTGDGARRNKDGKYRIIGRVDDVINVSGHRIGTAEVENAIDQHENVVEAAVVGYPHPIKGQGIYAYVITHENGKTEQEFKDEILKVVTKQIGPIAKPDKIQFVSGLPKTRSGKIMRRILRKIAGGDTSNLGDTSTLLDPGVVEEIKAGAQKA
jgi:acetyl-CoA synthetase